MKWIPDHKNASATASWKVGNYARSLFVIDSSDSNKRHQVEYGTFEIKANSAVWNADPRNDAQKNLELIEDILYNRVQGNVGSNSIAVRQLSKMLPSDLITLRDFYKRQVMMMERIRQDKGTGANILADFRRRF
mgnify:CR=1 FL=1